MILGFVNLVLKVMLKPNNLSCSVLKLYIAVCYLQMSNRLFTLKVKLILADCTFH